MLVAEGALYGHRLAEPTAALIVSLAGDYDHIAEGLDRLHRLGGRIAVQHPVRHFPKQQNSHQITPASFSLPSSSSTEPT
ncbi:hypothetical protein VB636_01620, partial [Paracoccus sp. APAP_BH8]